jgi:glycosyltransferase involved in cell wall biosynthesis
MLVALARNLSVLGCRCIVGVFCDARAPHTEVAEEARRLGLTVEIVTCNGRIDRTTLKQIRQLVKKHGIDVIHPHGYKADLYTYAAALPDRVALLATSHNWPSRSWNMRAYAALDRLALTRFDGVVAISDPIYKILRRWGVPQDKLVTIGNGVDIEQFENAEPTLRQEINSDGALVGFVGRFVPDKGGSFLLQAAQRVLASRPNAQFVLVGEGPSRADWQQLASKLGIAPSVIFTGRRNDMPGVYASLDVVVLPSLVESLPMCILEAMAARKPVIATEVGAIPSVIMPQRTGLILKPGDVDGLARAILQLLNNPSLAQELGQNAHTHVRQHFSAHSIAKAYMRQYEIIINRRSVTMHNRAQEKPSWLRQKARPD